MTVSLVCNVCKKLYMIKPYRKDKSKCCSKSCLWHYTKDKREPQRLLKVSNKKAYNNANKFIKCFNCNELFNLSPSRISTRLFCSKNCYSEKVHKVYGNNQKYIRINVNGKRILEHRFIMENFIKRSLLKEEHVHHVNGNKQDNRIENLELLSSSGHTKKHVHAFR